MTQYSPHLSVLPLETLAIFEELEIETFVDATAGAGGHSNLILAAHPEIQRLVAIDRDADARAIARERLAPYGEKVSIVAGNFGRLDDHLTQLGIGLVDAILMDIGVSSMQLDRESKGFSFSKEGPLDMRMDSSSSLTAAEIVNEWSEEAIAEILHNYGELPRSRDVAHAIVTERRHHPFSTTTELALRLKGKVRIPGREKIHPMTLLFQALRIAVNNELGELESALPQAIARLKPGGRLAVISFHSLEDGIVKRTFRDQAAKRISEPTHPMGWVPHEPTVEILTKKPIGPTQEECRTNPRSRSARLRAVERLP
jgi:16S rRNA (cytosine1402-N4)-methyltransferase